VIVELWSAVWVFESKSKTGKTTERLVPGVVTPKFNDFGDILMFENSYPYHSAIKRIAKTKTALNLLVDGKKEGFKKVKRIEFKCYLGTTNDRDHTGPPF